MNVTVVIPAQNEEAAMSHVIADIPKQVVSEIIVVDNGSTDQTAEVAKRAGARVISEPKPGYGQAVWRGMSAVDEACDIIVVLDGDYADDPTQIPRLIKPIIEGKADLVLGSRSLGRVDPGALTWAQRVGNRWVCAMIEGLFGIRFSDLGPFRAIRRGCFKKLCLKDRGYGWNVEMQIKAYLAGLMIQEISVPYRVRIGTSKISGTVSGTICAGLKIIGTAIQLRFSRS